MHEKLDTFDLRLVQVLQRDSRLTHAEIAEEIGLSPSQCSRRRARLEKTGVILGYSARIAPSAIGQNLQAIVRVNLSAHDQEAVKDFDRFMENSTEIAQAYSVSGDADYVLIIRVADLAAYADFIHKRLLPLSMVQRIRSDITLESYKT